MTKAGGKKLTRLLRALGLNAPLFGARHQHRRVVGLQFGFGLSASMLLRPWRSLSANHLVVHFKREQPREQIWNAT